MLYSWCALVCAFIAVMLMCFWNIRLWSNVTPRNLACLVVGIGLLCIWSGGMYSLVYLCTRPVMISSVVLFSLKLILDFPQNAAILFSVFCSLV